MTDPDGHPVNAVQGFALLLLERSGPAISPSRSMSGSKLVHSEIYPAYKANRDPAPPELASSLCRKLCRAFGVAGSRFRAGR